MVVCKSVQIHFLNKSIHIKYKKNTVLKNKEIDKRNLKFMSGRSRCNGENTTRKMHI